MKTMLACVLLLILAPAWAHKPSDSYLALRIDGTRIEGRWDIALRDLDTAVGLDGDGDGRLTWDELRARHRAIAAYALARLTVAAQGVPCTLHAGEQLIDEHTDGTYTVLPLRGTCPVTPARLTVGYRLFADTDAQHRGLLRLQAAGSVRTAILGGDRCRHERRRQRVGSQLHAACLIARERLAQRCTVPIDHERRRVGGAVEQTRRQRPHAQPQRGERDYGNSDEGRAGPRSREPGDKPS